MEPCSEAGTLTGPGVVAILTINSGSSSLKFGLYSDDGQTVLLSGKAEEIGRPEASLTIERPGSPPDQKETQAFPSQADALRAITSHLQVPSLAPITSIGHRIVHGGPHLREHCAITSGVLVTLEASVHFAPLHIPPALALIRATERQFPGVPQFACFDTQFHTSLPAEAYTYAIPKPYRDLGVRRYGFHGLSYASIVRLLGEERPAKLVVAHLGSGSSVCAIRDGRSIDTSMGLSPTGGVPMGTRTGDLDPAIVLLMQRGLPAGPEGMSIDQIESALNQQSGLLALAGDSDMRSLRLRADGGDMEASLAVTIFCSAVAKTIASYAAVLQGLDTLVFTGGIGEHSDPVRRQVCASLSFLGLQIAPEKEPRNASLLSTEDSSVAVRVMATDEDGEIARSVARMVQ